MKKLRILIMSFHHANENSVGALRTRAMEKYFPENGIEVFTVHYGKSKNKFFGAERSIGFPDGCRDSIGLFGAIILRALRYICTKILHTDLSENFIWEWNVKKRADDIIAWSTPDFILGSYPPTSSLELARWFSKTYKIRLITDFRDGFLCDALEADLRVN